MKEQNRKNRSIIARVTGKELMEFEEKCMKVGMNKSDYIRNVINKSEVYPADEIQKLTMQVLKVGRNINQIARILNTNPNSSVSANLQELVGEFEHIKDSLWKIEVDICR